MANCIKATRGAVGHLTKHYERAKDENGEYVKFKNEQIDTSKSHLNYNLAPEHNQLDFLHERLKNVYCLNRKDVNVMCSWVVTAPKELPEEKQREFFERTYQFLKDRYDPNEKNIISAYVHMDEITPHMHFCFLPVVYDKKKDREKVAAKEIINRKELQIFHTEFQRNIDDWIAEHDFSFDCQILNGATGNGNLTVQGLKAIELAERNEIEQDILSEIAKQSDQEFAELDYVRRERESLDKTISTLSTYKSALEDEIKALEGKSMAMQTERPLLVEKFLEHPKIKPVFEKYCHDTKNHLEEQRQKEKEPAERTMDDWQDAISKAKARNTSETKNQGVLKTHKNDRER